MEELREFTKEDRDSARECVMSFLDCISRNAYRGALKFTQRTWKDTRDRPHRYLERMFSCSKYESVRITATLRPSPEVIMLDVHFVVGEDERKWKIRVIPEKTKFISSHDGTWGVNPASLTVKS